MTDDEQKNQLLLRIDTLEVRISFLDDLTETLNSIVTQQAKNIDMLSEQLKLVYLQLSQQRSDSGIENFDPSHDVPPHY